MTLRITLLVLVTGLFSLIWTQDQPAPLPSLTETLVQNHERIPSALITAQIPEKDFPFAESALTNRFTFPATDWGIAGWRWAISQLDQASSRWQQTVLTQQVSHSQVASAMGDEIPLEDLWVFGDCEMPLPAGVVPGEYRIVSNTGIVRHLLLTLEDLQNYHEMESEFVTRDIYTTSDGELRWYFIRVASNSQTVQPAMAQRGRHIILPAVAPRGVTKHRPTIAERDESLRIQREAGQLIVHAGQKFADRVLNSLRPANRPSRVSSKDDDKKQF